MNIWENIPKPIQNIGCLALEAMLLEANCAPAPGLVDRFNSGAHNDMDIYTFIKSSVALSSYMYNFAYMGYMHKGALDTLLAFIRPLGIEAEAAMFKATEGVNTQKGLIFLMGILCAAAGYVYRKYNIIKSTLVFDAVKIMCQGLVAKELGKLPNDRKLTSGERLYHQYGIRGIRGELEDGLPIIKDIALPAYKKAITLGATDDTLLIYTLLSIMTATEDTTIINRHNMETLARVQREAKALLESNQVLESGGFEEIKKLDKKFIEQWISPGGSADLLAATHFLYSLDEKYGSLTFMDETIKTGSPTCIAIKD